MESKTAALRRKLACHVIPEDKSEVKEAVCEDGEPCKKEQVADLVRKFEHAGEEKMTLKVSKT